MEIVGVKWALLVVLGIAGLSIAEAGGEGQGRERQAVQLYSKHHGVPYAEAQRRIAKQAAIAGLQQKLAQEASGSFGGLYLEHLPRHRAIVLFTGDAPSQLARFTNDPFFVARNAPRSLRHLEEVLDAVANALQAAGFEATMGIVQETSEVDVEVMDEQAAIVALSALLSAHDFIRIHAVPSMPTSLTVDASSKRRCP